MTRTEHRRTKAQPHPASKRQSAPRLNGGGGSSQAQFPGRYSDAASLLRMAAAALDCGEPALAAAHDARAWALVRGDVP